MTVSPGVAWLRGLAGAGVAVVLLLCLVATRSPVARAIRRGEPISGAVIGTDLAEHAPHSDTLMVWLYRPSEGQLDVLSIPRDTRVDLPGYRFRRINEVFAYHYAQGRDPDAASLQVCRAVGQLLARAGAALEPSYYVQVDFDGFRRVIDRLGGVVVSVDEPMDYDDAAGNFHVHLATGVATLKGQDALGFVRFRGRSGDRGRILRQMEFVRALSKRLASPGILWRGPRATVEAWRAVRTNLPFWDLVFLSVEARRMTSQRVNTVLLPGRPRGATWEMDVERASFVLSRLGIARGGPTEIAPPDPGPVMEAGGEEEDAGGPSSPEVSAGPVTVKVWNASGRLGLAIAVTRRLRGAGFDVVEWGNYNGHQKKSRVIDRSGRFEQARRVAEALGLVSLYSDADPALRTDVEVLLGEDFRSTDVR
ncbi:MAG: LCP family protein [Elusimicrobia bacterium]|nr:LCP family protein [Elusimicrobiota bacterium]